MLQIFWHISCNASWYIYCDNVSMLMLFMETVEFCYRVKWIRYILLRNMKRSRSTVFGWLFCAQGLCVLVVVLSVVLWSRLLFSRVWPFDVQIRLFLPKCSTDKMHNLKADQVVIFNWWRWLVLDPKASKQPATIGKILNLAKIGFPYYSIFLPKIFCQDSIVVWVCGSNIDRRSYISVFTNQNNIHRKYSQFETKICRCCWD